MILPPADVIRAQTLASASMGGPVGWRPSRGAAADTDERWGRRGKVSKARPRGGLSPVLYPAAELCRDDASPSDRLAATDVSHSVTVSSRSDFSVLGEWSLAAADSSSAWLKYTSRGSSYTFLFSIVTTFCIMSGWTSSAHDVTLPFKLTSILKVNM